MALRPISYVKEREGSIAASAAIAARRTEMDRRGLPVPADVVITAHPEGPGPAEWVRPAAGSSEGTILFLHGSGYSKGSPASHRPLVARIVAESGIAAFVPDYRLAPEHRFPAALEDALDAYRFMLSVAEPDAIIVIGDSAGGGLALAMLMAARDEALPMPSAAATLSAWTDLAVTGNARPDVDDPIVTPDMLRVAADLYLDGADPRDPYASPLYGALDGLPPLLMQVGGREIMIEDTQRLADRAAAGGVAVKVSVYAGMTHVFQLNAPDAPEAASAIRELAAFARSHIRPRLKSKRA